MAADTITAQVDSSSEVVVGKDNVQNVIHVDKERDGGHIINDGNYIMLRMEAKLDQALAEQARIAQQVAEVARQQTQFDRRLYTIEAAAHSPMPMIDRAVVMLLALLMMAMFAYNALGVHP